MSGTPGPADAPTTTERSATERAAEERTVVRRTLEDVAVRLFAEQGYATTTVEQIVAAAGVSKPALYRHFASKKELYLALLRRHRAELAGVALAETVPDRPIGDTVGAMVEAWFAHVETHPFTWRMLFRDTTGDADIEAVHAEVHRAQVAADVALLRTVGPPFPPEQLEPLGEVVRASLAGLALWWLAHPTVPREVLVATMVRVISGLLATER